jgi:hypothetical protein
MGGVTHNGHEKLALLERVLQLHGDFRRSLESIRVTPFQAGVLLYLRLHADAKPTDAAAALRVRQPKKRSARGEINRQEFEDMKRD